jgi:hypothetical protein
LVVELVGEHASGLERALHEVLQALDGALGLRVGRLAEAPVELEPAAERGEPLSRTAVAGVQARLAIPDQRLREPPSDHRQRAIPQSRSGVCLVKTSAPAPARE